MKALRQYADFAGRPRRTEFWTFTLVNAGISIVLSLIDNAVIGTTATAGIGILSAIILIVFFATAGVPVPTDRPGSAPADPAAAAGG
ncbi:DUF805 domain-containing protein [Pseudonocardia sp. CA-107938]|uniref:DUF805 domain-containing protein n=1 Tax=Pseudonocardia sp. CA-107938 TaxID=3240021 RepID=UPI003D941401